MTEDVAMLCAVLGVACALAPPTYRVGRHAVTAIHEVGHALVAVCAGRELHAIRIRSDSSGEAVSVGRSHGPGVVATLFAGYPAPSIAGLAGVIAARTGYVTAWALVMAVVLVIFAPVLRGLFGVLVIASSLAVLVALLRWIHPATAMMVTSAVAWFLLTAGVRSCFELMRVRGASDARSLASLTGVPSAVWTLVFLALAVAGEVAGVRWGGPWPGALGR